MTNKSELDPRLFPQGQPRACGFLTKEQVALMWGVNVVDVDTAIADGLPTVEVGKRGDSYEDGGGIRIRRADLEAYVQGKQTAAPTPPMRLPGFPAMGQQRELTAPGSRVDVRKAMLAERERAKQSPK